MRLIDADKLKTLKSIQSADFNSIETIRQWIDSAPSIEIVRCVECRYKGMEICPMYKLTKAGVLKPYDFCSYGEREER